MIDAVLKECREKANLFRSLVELIDTPEFRSKFEKADAATQSVVIDFINTGDKKRLRGWLNNRPGGETLEELRKRAASMGIKYVCQKSTHKLRAEIHEHERRVGKTLAGN